MLISEIIKKYLKKNVLDVLRNVKLVIYNCIYATNGQTNGWNYTKFKSNLAITVIIYLSSLNSIGQSFFFQTELR